MLEAFRDDVRYAPATDIDRCFRNVRQVPEADMRLFDNLVGCGEQRLRNGQAERLRGL
jgi:hypothetical protein